jgi:hypothetical protein
MNGVTAAATGRVTSDVAERFTRAGKALLTFSLLTRTSHSRPLGSR